ncbi:glycosyltransferase [Parahaliea maris]|uniref:Glycosyltransferase n=1 Tax=Parahaliea maris TaxID=2716870 RepID=A0A5C8ZS48_9GAMM|nr:glycosyltransferase [Parahaliea maris]TXS91333.1 glycosyltransferase [Parahaliea maris]
MTNIVVLGMHRSGTSMVAGALVQNGMYVGADDELLAPQKGENPLGFFERTDVVELNDGLLAEASGSWYSPPLSVDDIRGHGSEQKRIISALEQRSPWLIKDPRMILTWSCWSELLAGSLAIYVYRNPRDVAVSLHRRNGFPLALGLLLWERYNREALAVAAGMSHVCVSFDAIQADPGAELGKLSVALAAHGLASRLGQEGYSPTLPHSRSALSSVADSLMTESQRALENYCEAVCNGAQLDLAAIPATDDIAAARLSDLASSLSALASLRETEARLAEERALTLERTEERDRSLSQLSSLEVEYRALDEAHKHEVSAHHSLQADHSGLVQAHRRELDAHDQLRHLHSELEAKTDHLFHELSETSRYLLEYEPSRIAGINRAVTRSYKWLTRRSAEVTSYDIALRRAREHCETFGITVPEREPGKVGQLWNILSYMARHPVSSLRSFSYPRLRRGLQMLFSSNSDDFAVWVGSRFPGYVPEAYEFDLGSLRAELDTLELEFAQVDQPRVSIVVPVYNEYRMTVNCLESILKQTSDSARYEVIVADDCSSDLTRSIADRISNVEVVRGATNLGFLGNCNRAAEQARGEFILFLNNDTAVTEGWLDRLVGLMDSDESIGLAGPKLLYPNGKLQEAGGIVWSDASAWNYGKLDNADKPAYNYVKDVDYISGACLLIRSSIWQQLGGFDARYSPAYYEDTDIAFAVRSLGFRVVYQPASRVVHFEGVSNGTDLKEGLKQYQVRNREIFQDKWREELESFHFENAEHVFWARDRSRERRSILIIDHYVPHYDKDAGSRSTFMYIKQMVHMGYKVLFLGANFFPHEPYTETLQQLGVEVLVGEPMARGLDRWLAENTRYIDTIYIHRPHVAEQFLPHLERLENRPPIVFFGHDLHYLRTRREGAVLSESSLEKEASRWHSREFAVFDRVDKIYYPSEVEVAAISKERPDLDVCSIPLYAIEPAADTTYARDERQGMLFVGGFNHPPNVDAINWFVREVLPLVHIECPLVQLHIVGSNATEQVAALGDEPGVTFHGFLSDEELEALYQRVRQVVVPLRFGAGVKGKVLDALARELPVVATSVGAEGIPEAEDVLCIANDANDFAAVVIAIEKGAMDVSSLLMRVPQWLEERYSKRAVQVLLQRDFGHPLREPLNIEATA